jgi:hypothetical protein
VDVGCAVGAAVGTSVGSDPAVSGIVIVAIGCGDTVADVACTTAEGEGGGVF